MPLITGISPDTWRDTESKEGFETCPIGHGLPFVVEKIKADVTKRDPEVEYVTFGCKYTDDEGKAYWLWNYFELSEERLGFLKSFLEKVGRCDMMLDGSDWEEMEDTEFNADVRHSKGKDGQLYANFVNTSIQAVSHDMTDLELLLAEDELEDGDATTDLDSKIEQEAARNEKEAEQTQEALKKAKSTKVAPESKPASKASPRRPRRAGSGR